MAIKFGVKRTTEYVSNGYVKTEDLIAQLAEPPEEKFIGTYRFILAGKAVFTLTGPDGKHYTYRVRKAKQSTYYKDPVWWVNLGIGYEDSIPAGRIRSDDVFIAPNTATLNAGSPSIQLFTTFWNAVRSGLETDIRFQHEGKCCVCGRPLTNPDSIDAGIGPECAGKG